eukprot:5712505-Prymnesium_polylepis.1
MDRGTCHDENNGVPRRSCDVWPCVPVRWLPPWQPQHGRDRAAGQQHKIYRRSRCARQVSWHILGNGAVAAVHHRDACVTAWPAF